MKAVSVTDVGKKRQLNQDIVFSSEKALGHLPNVFIVADGTSRIDARTPPAEQAKKTGIHEGLPGFVYPGLTGIFQNGISSSMSSKLGAFLAGAAPRDGAGADGILPPYSASPPDDEPPLLRPPSICISLASISVV